MHSAPTLSSAYKIKNTETLLLFYCIIKEVLRPPLLNAQAAEARASLGVYEAAITDLEGELRALQVCVLCMLCPPQAPDGALPGRWGM